MLKYYNTPPQHVNGIRVVKGEEKKEEKKKKICVEKKKNLNSMRYCYG
jgi:hypothetical protein